MVIRNENRDSVTWALVITLELFTRLILSSAVRHLSNICNTTHINGVTLTGFD